MKTLKCYLRTVVLIAIGLSCIPVVWADLNDGLIAHYPFNGNAKNAIYPSHHGTVHGAALTEDRFGNPQNAYSFDGNDHIQFNTPIVQQFPPYSISLWVKYYVVPNVNAYIIANGGQTNSSQGFYLTVVGASEVYCGHSYPMGAVSFGIGNQTYKIGFGISAEMTSGQWHHVTGTWDGRSLALYIDGQLAQGNICGGRTNYGPQNNMRIGAPSNTLKYFFNGQLDDVRLYNRALSECEIKTLYTGEDKCDEGEISSSDNCWATYENRKLHIPCIKLKSPDGKELHYEVDMQYKPLSQPMSFQLTGAKPK